MADKDIARINMGKSAWWAVPVSVLIGIPMYSNAAGIIPIVQALLEKGAALGTVLKPTRIAAFFGVVGFGILIVGYLFNLLF